MYLPTVSNKTYVTGPEHLLSWRNRYRYDGIGLVTISFIAFVCVLAGTVGFLHSSIFCVILSTVRAIHLRDRATTKYLLLVFFVSQWQIL